MQNTEELDRLEILRAYKQHFAHCQTPGDSGVGEAFPSASARADTNVSSTAPDSPIESVEHPGNYSPFADHRVVGYDTQIAAWDVPEIHEPVRQAIRDGIVELHQGHSSRVVIFAGQPGMGKSHLLNYFRDPARQEELGYVLVGNSNHWKVEEFEACLLTWLVAALARPSPVGPNLLLEKIKDIAFQALDQILDQPGKLREFLGGESGFLGRLWSRIGFDPHARFRQAVLKRDTAIFRRLDFHAFADFVCQRFLHDKSNPFHLFVVHVLLRYLFPEDRGKVLAWLIGQQMQEAFCHGLGGPYKHRQQEPRDPHWPPEADVQAHLLDKVGVADRLDCNYKFIDTIKILVSLFDPEVNKHRTNGDGYPGRVFFFAFDQVEGRQELFESRGDWFKFFAKLSELYNALPNVFIVFTMTNQLRNDLYPKMEAQFQQRIHRDQKFVLQEIDDKEILAIYRRHLALWRADRLPDVEPMLVNPSFQYLPFTQEEILGRGRNKSVRAMLEAFDYDFRDYMNKRVVAGADARLEFLVAVNELRDTEKTHTTFQYTEEHLGNVQNLLQQAGGTIAAAMGLTMEGIQPATTPEGLDALRIELRKTPRDERWVRIYLVRLPFQYRDKLNQCLNLLYHKATDRNFLWIVRPERLDREECEGKKAGQVFARKLDARTETYVQALLQLLDKQQAFGAQPQASATDEASFREDVARILVEEIKLTYLGEMFQHAADALDRLQEATVDDPE